MDSTRSALRELARDSRAATAIGRHARLELTFESRDGRTVLADGYAEPPLRLGRLFDADGAAYMIMVCSAPGIFGGDVLEQRVSVGPGARVLLVSQSALQVHPAVDGVPAVVHSRYHVESGGELHCHWDATIPFAHASLEQRVSIDLASGSRFVWSDALMSGRAARGESWQFAFLDHELRLAVDGALQYLERYTLDPAVRAPAHLWRWGPAHYAGTALVYHDAVTSAFAERAQEALAGVDGVSSGVDLLEAHLVLARLLAAGGAPFTKARSVFRDLTLDAVFGAPGLVARR